MRLDMATLALAVSVSMIIRVTATTIQYSINRAYRGIGLWALASACAAVGFTILMIRSAATTPPITIVVQNGLLVLAVVLEYLGTMAFLDRPSHPRITWSAFAAFLAVLAALTLVYDAIGPRTIVVHAAIAVTSLWTGWNLWADRRPSIRLSTRFISVVFLLSGSFYALRAFLLMGGVGAESMTLPTVMQIAELVVVLVEGSILTYGLIIMVGQRLHSEATDSKERFKLLFNTSPDAAVINGLDDGTIVSVNDGFSAMIGYSRREVIGQSTLDLLWADPPERKRFVSGLADHGYIDDFESMFKRRDGSTFVGMVSSKVFVLEGVPHVISVIRDITERKAMEVELTVRATTDGLTGVGNRAHFMDVAGSELDRAMRHHHPMSVALLDVDHFKRINDTEGHLAGDSVLIALAGIVQGTIRSIDALARFGGDEFVVLMPETGLGGAAEVAERIRAAVESSQSTADAEPGSLTVCLGVATLREGEHSLDAALGRADIALYQAKQAGRNRVECETVDC